MKDTPGVLNAGEVRPFLQLPPVTFDQAVQFVEAGCCVVCQERGHPYGRCPAHQLSKVEDRLAVQVFMQRFNTAKAAAQRAAA
jgi:hypothetical protein